MPSQHAQLSPSASARWLSCPASVRVAELYKSSGGESIYAAEGTAAHSLGELKASLAIGRITEKEYPWRRETWEREEWAPLGLHPESLAEVERHTDDYVELLQERAKLHPHTQVLLEQRMDTGVPGCWGTGDAVLVSPVHVEIIDLKYGAGVPVSAEDNSQLRLYGLGALDTFGDVLGDTQTVRMTIFQPRLDSVSTEELTADELRAWRTRILPIAEEALGENARFGPSEKACRWCPAAGECRARIEKMTQEDFGTDPDLITPEEMGELLGRLPEIRDWVRAVEEAALTKAYSEGVHIPGWKVVLSGGQRTITDPDTVAQSLVSAGVPEESVWKRTLAGLGDIEKQLKTLPKIKPEGAKRARYQRLEDVAPSDALGRTPGRESLVREDDPRPAVNPNNEAQKEFS